MCVDFFYSPLDRAAVQLRRKQRVILRPGSCLPRVRVRRALRASTAIYHLVLGFQPRGALGEQVELHVVGFLGFIFRLRGTREA
jgi:hypothetical protein